MIAFRPWQSQATRESDLDHDLDHDLEDLIDITISDLSKEDETSAHENRVDKWVKERSIIDDKIIVYSDGSQSEKGYNGAGIFLTNSSFSRQESMAWNLGKECEVYDAELFAILKALELGLKKSRIETLDIWIFSDSQAALKGLKSG